MSVARRPAEGSRRRWISPLAGVAVAIAVTATMDARGLSALSALPLFPLLLLFSLGERIPRRALGFVSGAWRHHALAAALPIAVIGAVALAAIAAGAVDSAGTDWRKAALNGVAIALSTILVATLTEEGFFRGWLWASLRRSGRRSGATLAWSSAAFSLWHLSAVALETGFDLPAPRIPVYLVNAGLLGAAWGILRAISGSVVVAAVSHGIWNGLAYSLFGFGTRTGALGIERSAIWGPEVGLVGVAVNAAVVVLLWRAWRRGTGTAEQESASPSR